VERLLDVGPVGAAGEGNVAALLQLREHPAAHLARPQRVAGAHALDDGGAGRGVEGAGRHFDEIGAFAHRSASPAGAAMAATVESLCHARAEPLRSSCSYRLIRVNPRSSASI